jgi:hypothetical protein
MTNIERDKEEDKELPILRLITGGKAPIGSNWLSSLPKGTVFLCRPIVHQGKPFLEEYHVVFQSECATRLHTNINAEGNFWVDPISFCGIMELVEILIKGEDV